MAENSNNMRAADNRRYTPRCLILMVVILALTQLYASSLDWANAATTINVTTTADEYGADALCSLREAVQAANTNLPFGGCMAGSGVLDTINLYAGTYALTIDGFDTGDSADNSIGDLDITEAVIISGAGSGFSFIKGGVDFDDHVLYISSASGTNITGWGSVMESHQLPAGG